MNRYPALLEPDGKGGFAVTFPDVPGCFSAGVDYADALANAIEALNLHAMEMAKAGEPIVPPRDLAAIQADPDWQDMLLQCIVALIPYSPADQSAPSRLNISMEPQTIALIDTAAEAAGMTRSAWLSRAALYFIADHPNRGRPVKNRKRRAA